MIYFRKLQLHFLIFSIFLVTDIAVLGIPLNQESDETVRRESVNKFLDQLMEIETIPSPDNEHFDISIDGHWVAFAVKRGFKEDDIYPLGRLRKLPGGIPNPFIRQDIWIAGMKNGELRRITNGKTGKNSYWHPVWSPNGRDLAFYGDKGGRVVPWICRNANGKKPRIQAFEDAALKAALFRWDRPRWMPDGRRLILPLLPEIEKNNNPGVDDNPLYLIPSLYHKFLNPQAGSTVNIIRSSDESSLDRHFVSESSVDLAILDIASGKIQKLTNGQNVQRWELSPDGRLLAFKVYKKTVPGTYDSFFDLYVMSLEDGSTRLLLEDTEIGHYFYSSGILWSPDSTLLLEMKNKELVVVNAKSGEKKVVTPSDDSSFKKIFRHPMQMQRTVGNTNYIWSPRGDGVIAQNEAGWWLLSLDDSPPRILFKNTSVKIVRILRKGGDGNAFSLDGHSLVSETVDPNNGEKVLYKTDLFDDQIEPVGVVPNFSSIYEISEEGIILFSSEENDIKNLWSAYIDFSKTLKLTDLNSHLKQIPRGKQLLIECRDKDGKRLKGAILLPPDYEEGKRYPLITYVYAGSSISTLEQSFSLIFHPVASLPQLLSQCGYIVLRPSIPLSPMGQKGSPLKEIPESVISAINKVIEMGLADPDRIGAIGQSYGGYTVNVLITQTRIYKAAVSMAGLTDLISHYLIFDSRFRYTTGGTGGHMSWAEAGQGRMGVTLWEDRFQYIENSPIFYLDKVDTPLLIIHGDLDVCPIQEAEEMYTGLKRLGKEVEFARYFGEGHVLSKPANIRDSWQRIVAWFDKHLRVN